MTIQFYFKPNNLEKQMDPDFADFKEEIINNLQKEVEIQKTIEVSEIFIEISKEDHLASNYRAEVRIIPQKSSLFEEIRVVQEHKEYIPAVRQASKKATEILMKMKEKVLD